MEDYSRRLHEEDTDFGAVLLMVCAIGSRWMEHEPRVLIHDQGLKHNSHSAGWPYFQQVQRVPKFHSHSHSLAAMQSYAVSQQFWQSCQMKFTIETRLIPAFGHLLIGF